MWFLEEGTVARITFAGEVGGLGRTSFKDGITVELDCGPVYCIRFWPLFCLFAGPTPSANPLGISNRTSRSVTSSLLAA